MPCQVSADFPLLVQLSYLNLRNNQLAGTLPETWSQLVSVSLEQCCHIRLALQLISSGANTVLVPKFQKDGWHT